MAEQELKTFKLSGYLKDNKTHDIVKVLNIKIQGYYGADAVDRYCKKLEEEGLYYLAPNYSYFEQPK